MDLWLDSGSRELELSEQIQLSFFEGDREVLDFEARTGWIAARTDEQELVLRRHGRGSEILLGGGEKIFAQASFSSDGERLIAFGARASDYSGLIDCYATESGALLWSREVSFVAKKSLLKEGDKILVSNYHNQHRDGVAAVQLLNASSGTLVAELRSVPYKKSAGLSELRSGDGKRLVYPSTDGILVVDTVLGALRWIGEMVRNDAYLSMDGRYLAFTSRLSRAPEKVMDLDGERGTVKLADFVGFQEAWPGPFWFLFSRDGRSFYAISEASGIERWDLLTGMKIADFKFQRMRWLKVVEYGGRVFALGKLSATMDDSVATASGASEERIQFLEFDADTGELLSAKSWKLVTHSSQGAFGRTTSSLAFDMKLLKDAQAVEIELNGSRLRREFGSQEFEEAKDSGPVRARAASYLNSKEVFRVVWADGSVSDFDGDSLEETFVWRNPLLAMGGRVMIDPDTGHIVNRILYDVLVFDGDTGAVIYTLDETYDIDSVSDIRGGGTRLLLGKKAGGEQKYGVYDLVLDDYVLRAADIGGFSTGGTLSDSGEKLVVLSPAQFASGRDFELVVYDVDSASLLARTGELSASGALVFSPDESRIVFASRNAGGGSAPRLGLMEMVLDTGEVSEVLDLTVLGDIAEPSELAFLKAGNSVLVRSQFDCLYIVDIDTGSYSPIKYMRLGPIKKDEASLRDQAIAASDSCYAMFDGRGRVELGHLQSAFDEEGSVALVGRDGLSFEALAGKAARLLWSEDGVVWIDKESPVVGRSVDLGALVGRFARVVWQQGD